MNDSRLKTLFVDYLFCCELIRELESGIPSALMSQRDTGGEVATRLLNHMAGCLKLDHSELTKLLSPHIKDLLSHKSPTDDLLSSLKAFKDIIQSQIGSFERSTTKAYDFLRAVIEVSGFTGRNEAYDAMVLLRQEVEPLVASKIIRLWKEQSRSHRDGQAGILRTNIFWSSEWFKESLDGISRYRFRECFEIGEFDTAFNEVEHRISASLIGAQDLVERLEGGLWGSSCVLAAPFNLWMISRARNLQDRIRRFVDIALNRIVGWQRPEGYWLGDAIREQKTETGEVQHAVVGNPYITALGSLALLKLGRSNEMRERGILAARWLLEEQNADGSWSQPPDGRRGSKENPSLLVSILALEAIARSGIPNVSHSIDLGTNWVLTQQTDLGTWEEMRIPFPSVTVIVLEFFNLKESLDKSKELDSYVRLSLAFLRRSLQLCLEDDVTSQQLAIISCFHATEFLLYSLLTRQNVKIFQGRDTIGFRKALAALQAQLQQQNVLKQNEPVPFRNSLDRLAYLRDEVVHKGIEINRSTSEPLISDVTKFATRYSLEILGYDLWT